MARGLALGFRVMLSHVPPIMLDQPTEPLTVLDLQYLGSRPEAMCLHFFETRCESRCLPPLGNACGNNELLKIEK